MSSVVSFHSLYAVFFILPSLVPFLFKKELMFLPFTFTVKEPIFQKNFYFFLIMENRGLEPLTLGLQSRCSSQLS